MKPFNWNIVVMAGFGALLASGIIIAVERDRADHDARYALDTAIAEANTACLAEGHIPVVSNMSTPGLEPHIWVVCINVDAVEGFEVMR